MIISRTPLRMSFAGGGTDLPAFAEQHGGAVVSTAIDKWIRVVVSHRFEGDVRVGYSETEIVSDANHVRHELVREAMRRAGIPRGVDVLTLADVPSRGTGLGSSSAVTVGLLNALYAFQGIAKPAMTLADEACQIEIEVLGKPIGRQDQYASAVGGCNLIEFLPGRGGVKVSPLLTPPGTIERLHAHLLLFYTGQPRGSDEILRAQGDAVSAGDAAERMIQMRDLAYELRDRLQTGDVESVGEILRRGWELKRSAAGVAGNDAIESAIAAAHDAGAVGGKLLGAGGGGFLLLFAPPDAQLRVRDALDQLREIPFRFAFQGTSILLLEQA
ncbi:MAG: galactokinase [Solirubrobacterales bacterium]|nr:galactokinase [Solirubrobacterales bacterium]